MRNGRALPLALMVALAGCGSGGSNPRTVDATAPVHLRPDQRPTSIGVGPGYRVPPISPAVAHRQPVGGMPCAPLASQPRPYGVHLELFARGRVLIVPAGIGVAPPQRRQGAYVLGGPCGYPIRTLDPTGVIRVSGGIRTPALGDFFAIWGQPLTKARLATFRGRVRAFVGGRQWHRAPSAIPLTRHSEIVLEVGTRIPAHPTYRFPPGL